MMLRIYCVYFTSFLYFGVVQSINNVSIFYELSDLNSNIYRSISSCIVEISKRELFWRPTIVLSTENEDSNRNFFVDEAIAKLAVEKVPFMKLYDSFENISRDVNEASYLVVGYFEDCDELTNVTFDLVVDKVKYLIILDSYWSDTCERSFRDSGDIIGRHDVSFFVKNAQDLYELFTFVPEIDSQTCKVVVRDPLKINTCVRGKLNEKDIFPLKNPSNFNKCPIKVGMSTRYPFSSIANQSSLKVNDKIDINRVTGMDIELLKIILNYFNATMDLIYIYKIEKSGSLTRKFIDLVHNGSLEICAGGLYRIYGDSVEYSGIYARQFISWMYYTERLKRTWKEFFTAVDGLYLFVIFYLCYSAVSYLTRVSDKDAVSLNGTLLNAWGVLLSTTSLQGARTLKQKILNSVYLIMCLHLSVYTNIQMYSFFSIQGPPATYKSNDAVMKSGIVPYLHPYTKNFIKDEKHLAFVNTSKDCSNLTDCAYQSFIHKGMTSLLQGFAYRFQVETAVGDEVRMLPTTEHLLTVYYEMTIRKKHPVVQKFQRAMRRLFEAGVTEKLVKEAIGITLLNKAKGATKNLMSNSYSCQSGCTISIKQFGGVLYIVAFGCIASAVTFILELIRKKKEMLN